MTEDGTVIYVGGATRRQLTIIAPDGSTRALGETGPLWWPRLSPDGRTIAVTAGLLDAREVWTYSVSNAQLARLPIPGARNDRPEWTADGRSLLVRSSRAGDYNTMWLQPIDGGAASQLVGDAHAQIDEGVLSPDGKYIIFQRDSTGNSEVWYRALSGDTAWRFVDGRQNGANGARFSPDGRFIAYASYGLGPVPQIVVRTFPALGPPQQITTNGGTTPVWSADGKRIYFVNNEQLLAVDVNSLAPPSFSAPKVILSRQYSFNIVHADYDVARDGKTVVALRTPQQTSQIVVVRNLLSEILSRVKAVPGR
jgi:Tol biopolymer transport system component